MHHVLVLACGGRQAISARLVVITGASEGRVEWVRGKGSADAPVGGPMGGGKFEGTYGNAACWFW